MRSSLHSIVALALVSIAPASGWAQDLPSPVPGQATFSIFVRATPVGVERVELTSTSDGWLITSTGQLSAPVELQNQRFLVRYDRTWQPAQLEIDGVRGSVPFSMRSTFSATSATHELREADKVDRHTDSIVPGAIVLPNYFFAAYEALAVRLATTKPGDELPIYVAPRGQISARVNDVLPQDIQTSARTISARVYRLTFANPTRPLAAEVWTDQNHRLLRVSLPEVFLDVAREDIIAVSSRLQTLHHPGDEDVRVSSSGFSLAATVTKPVTGDRPPAGWPAVVLVPGSAALDRDGTVAGVPILGQIAGALADRGFLVARYDKRGAGQSGGRSESASLNDFADDVRTMVRYLERRDDVDRRRIAVVGHSEGGWVALATAAREDRIAALAMLAAPGTTGVGLVVEQQQTALDQLSLTEAERRERVELQARINAAVVGDGSWDEVPQPLREQADTPWFRSFLRFDPADAIRRTRQPVLILQGTLDRQVLPHHAGRLADLARARDRQVATDVVLLDGINHLLVAAASGHVDEYARLADRNVSRAAIDGLADWLSKTLPPGR